MNGSTFFAKLTFFRQNFFWYFRKGKSFWAKKKFGGKKINLAEAFSLYESLKNTHISEWISLYSLIISHNNLKETTKFSKKVDF
jgi:hypothetical protein